MSENDLVIGDDHYTSRGRRGVHDGKNEMMALVIDDTRSQDESEKTSHSEAEDCISAHPNSLVFDGKHRCCLMLHSSLRIAELMAVESSRSGNLNS